MAALKHVCFVGALLAATVCLAMSAQADDIAIDRWRELIAAASRTFGVPESWISSVMRAESAGLETLAGKPITSPKGAMGLMQIMPRTWAGLRSRYGLGDDPYDPHDNIFAGAAYLRELYQRYGYPNLFAAYNAGPGRLDSYFGLGEGLPAETQDYLAKLAAQSGTSPPLPADRRVFFELTGHGLDAPTAEPGRLFVVLKGAPAVQ
jgi:soluble lytic murein transglycosylase-like protein